MMKAGENIPKPNPRIRKPWITEAALDLIIKKHRMEEQGKPEETNKAIKEVRKAKRKDWKTWVQEQTKEWRTGC